MVRALVIAALSLFAFAGASSAADTVPLSELAKPGRVLMLRHAHAPGYADPPEFKIGDCSTQRNLDVRGREQATELGKRIAKAGIRKARVYSSQWCRCLETARLLALGPVTELPALNSFHGRPQERDLRMSALHAFFAKLPTDGPPIVLVTHQVTINDLTGHGAPSGSGMILALDGTGQPRVLRQIPAN